METAQIVFQILTALVTVLAIFQKQKWKMMLLYTICNLLCVAMYFVFGRTASACICIVAAVRTFVYMFYSLKKIKPNVVWLIIFEIGFVVTTILTWNDAFDLLPLMAMLSVGYGSWQDNQTILYSSYIISKTLYVVYKVIIGAYISMTVEAINLVCTIISLVYYCILKKETPISQRLFGKKPQKQENETNKEIESHT